MAYQGDYHLGDTVQFKFSTVNTSSVMTSLAGTPILACYVNGSTVELTGVVNLTTDFDGRTGLNHVSITASSGNGFTAQTNIDVVITQGTVGGTSVVGMVVGQFSIDNRTNAMVNAALTESYAADGATPTLTQALFEIMQWLEERAVSGTTMTVKKRDGSTTAMTFTLNDATSPTSITRSG